MFRSTHSHSVKKDINNDYGIYPENGEVVMEAVDRNTEYEEQVAGGEDQMYDYENWEDEYDKMYEEQANERENDYDKMYE